ncbi:site-specific DNA-methyltransferase [Teredinibacter sp. KSP-S5-2]|uniref:site-specific DNA-methyltransferase n=1 Tax=Teredinibacter sp. KSP-S5-2 TaxID=3034506 RepID=UPI002934B0F6|nr:site-specific DNA-methyltransferase [Teredinibacter sp. KSP-S5-2]WNO10411.1 site-specific DNA-methyltransferase [Teredinibacter sp. KSP-S5-2]
MQPIVVSTIEQWPVAKLIPYARNARTHSDTQVDQIAASIVEFGFVNPILVGENNVIVAGHGRLFAAQKLGMDVVPVIVLSHLSDTQRRALIIADNQLALGAGWSEEMLHLELAELSELDFDLDLLGFSDADLDKYLSLDTDESKEAEESVPEPEENPIAKLGDIWILGEHRLMCGDSTNMDDVNRLMDGGLADMVVQDPPYNVDYGNAAKDKMRHNKRTILNDNLGNQFYDFLVAVLKNSLAVCKGAVYVSMSSSELDTLQRAFIEAGGKWSTFIIWAKNHFTMGRSDYQRQYEPILYGWKEGEERFWCGVRNESDLWFVDKPVKNDIHPTMKPVALFERAIKNSSKRRDIVLDLFGGSGTTMIACEKTDRRARLMELDPKYVDVIIRRWQEFSGGEAVHADTGKVFASGDNTLIAEEETVTGNTA